VSLVDDPRPETDPQSKVDTFVDRTRHAVSAVGHFDPLFQSYLDHAAKVDALPTPAMLPLVRSALAGSALHLSLLPRDQHCSWTLNFREPLCNVFVAGDNDSFQLTARSFDKNIETIEGSNRIFVEMQRPRLPVSRSVAEFDTTDVLGAFEGYFQRAVQIRARLFAFADGRCALIEGLPTVDEPWLEALDSGSAAAYLASDLEEMESRSYEFGCGCNQERLIGVLRSMSEEAGNELFDDRDMLEAECPRCGQGYEISRKDLAT